MTITRLGLGLNAAGISVLKPIQARHAIQPPVVADTFVKSPRFGSTDEVDEPETRPDVVIATQCIDGELDDENKLSLIRRLRDPSLDLTGPVPEKLRRADGRYFGIEADASTQSVLGLAWIRAAIDAKNKPSDPVNQTLIATLAAMPLNYEGIRVLAEIGFDTIHAPAPDAYLNRIETYAYGDSTINRVAVARGFITHANLNHLPDRLMSVVEELASDDEASVRSYVSCAVGLTGDLNDMPSRMTQVALRLAKDNVDFVRRALGVINNPLLADAPDELIKLVEQLASEELTSVRDVISHNLGKNSGLYRFSDRLIRVIQTLAKDDETTVRSRLAVGIGLNTCSATLPPALQWTLNQLVTDTHEGVKGALVVGLLENKALPNVSPSIIEAVAKLARDNGTLAQHMLAFNLPRHPRRADFPELLERLTSELEKATAA